MLLGCLLLGAALVILFLKITFPIISIIFIGVSFSIVACSYWPCIPRIVEDYQSATAYGFCYAIQNLGLFAGALVIGDLISTGYYDSMMISFIISAFCAVILCCSVIACDFIIGRKINRSRWELQQDLNYSEVSAVESQVTPRPKLSPSNSLLQRSSSDDDSESNLHSSILRNSIVVESLRFYDDE